MDDITKEFLVESYENLDQMERDLVKLEKDPHSKETLGSIFRTMHTLKGSSGFLAFGQMEAVAHVGENLLSKLRDGVLTINPEITSGLLATVDAVRFMLGQIEQTGQSGEKDFSDLVQRLTQLNQGTSLRSSEAVPGVPWAANPSEAEPAASAPTSLLASAPQAAPAAAVAPSPAPANAPPPPSAAEAVPAAGEPPLETRNSAVSDSNIRVDVGLLDKLMNLVGELVLARNQVLQFTSQSADSTFLATSQRLNLITTELQENVMKTRMQPIGNVWSKLPRVVRDLAASCGKQVRLEMEGKETELDKTIIEAIKDPLTHIVRNSVDHGIERPEARVERGKPVEGCLRMRAYHEGGQVNIEITDDGSGIDYERVKAKAVQCGLITAELAARMNDHEALNLIFVPGFSTAEKVTNVSGRGVGMDVVKTNIEKIGGTVDLQSQPGEGTTLKMKIPLTLAIIPALIVTSGGDRFAIPQVSLLELVRLQGKQAKIGIEFIHGAPVHRLRGRLLPLVYLKRELMGDAKSQAQGAARAQNASGAQLLDFDLARDKHRRWFDRLRQHLDGKIAISSEETGSHKNCALGKWLHSEGREDYAYIPEFPALEKKHADFHDLVNRIVRLRASGHQTEAEQEFGTVLTSSQEVIGLLTAVEQKVLQTEDVNIVVLQADGHPFGLVVDEINDTEEIVVKPLGKQLKGVASFAGATIMGDGRVALILDVLGLAQGASVVTEVRDRTLLENATQARKKTDVRQTLLLFEAGQGSRMAIPLSMVARLEEFPPSSVEHSGAQEVVQYRGQILPLIRVSKYVPAVTAAASDDTQQPMQVVVYSEEGRSVGLIVGRISDIVQEAITVKRHASGQGLFGSVVIQDKVTDLLDVQAVIRAADPAFYGGKSVVQLATYPPSKPHPYD
jgi:chemotaxis protein histidine kinase CheA